MGPFDRALLTIYTVIVSIVAVLGLLMLSGLLTPVSPSGYVTREVQMAVLGVFLLAGLRLLFSGRARKPDRQAVVDETVLGEVKVSLTAIESLIVKVASAVPGIREVKPRVLSEREMMAIEIKAAVSPDVNIPELSQNLQQVVQDAVRDVTGLTVQKIRVSVENIASHKGRVE